MEELVDAFLDLGPQHLRLREKIPADIALDVNYRMELQGFHNGTSETPKEFDQEIVNSAADPLFLIPKPKYASFLDPELSKAVQTCLDMKSGGKAQ